jgi:hypothetical protein
MQTYVECVVQTCDSSELDLPVEGVTFQKGWMALKKSAFASGFVPDEGIFLRTVGCYPLLWRGARVSCQ